jgi:hypothetical protein
MGNLHPAGPSRRWPYRGPPRPGPLPATGRTELARPDNPRPPCRHRLTASESPGPTDRFRVAWADSWLESTRSGRPARCPVCLASASGRGPPRLPRRALPLDQGGLPRERPPPACLVLLEPRAAAPSPIRVEPDPSLRRSESSPVRVEPDSEALSSDSEPGLPPPAAPGREPDSSPAQVSGRVRPPPSESPSESAGPHLPRSEREAPFRT